MYLTFKPSLSKKPRSAATRNGSAVQLEPPVQPRFRTLGSAADANATDSATSTQAVKNSNCFRFIAHPFSARPRLSSALSHQDIFGKNPECAARMRRQRQDGNRPNPC